MKKVVIVTGAAGHLGQAVVDRLAREDVQLVAVVSPRKAAESLGPHVETVALDATDEGAARTLVESVKKKHGGLHGLVATIGGFHAGGMKDTGLEEFEKMIRLNFYTAYAFARPALEAMQGAGGRMVFIGTRPALVPAEGRNAIAYALSKSLVFGLADSLNAGTNRHGVVASVLVPGTIDTPDNRKSMPEADFAKWIPPGALADMAWELVSGRHEAWREPVVKFYGDT
jgi:NAD(P)-dependent dehydrogenase (short-subunit alcohol dehydrogenase family)